MKLSVLSIALFASSTLILATPVQHSQAAHSWKVPVVERKLSNGLTVLVSEDHTTPTFGISISYGIGARLEPQGRSGFAHLFEHLMFEGTPDAPKGVFGDVVTAGGGLKNGSTGLDSTVYVDEAPISALNPILWLEADRMKTLDFSVANLNNQRSVVEEEERSRELNQPYALFYLIDLREKAFDTFANQHNMSGDFKDLGAAKIDDVKAFFNEYYAPNNAVLAVAGDVNPEEVFATVEKYFGGIPRRDTPPRPDVSEPPQKAERQFTQEDRLAPLPALAIGYRMPPRKSRDAIVGTVVGDLLYGGKASRLYQSLVANKKVVISVAGGMNWPFGPLEYNGPALMTGFIIYPNDVKESDVLSAYDAVIQNLASNPVSASELEDVVTKARSDWYGELETPIARAVALSQATLFDGTPVMVNAVPGELASVTPAEIQAFVQKYLVKTNRTIINRVPAASVKQSSATDVKGSE